MTLAIKKSPQLARKSKMVREIVHVLLDQCVNQIGNAFWNALSTEHKLFVDKIRKEVESCDCLHGFELIHALRGGTSLEKLLSLKIRDNHWDRITATVSKYASLKVSDVIEQYNDTISTHK